MIEKSRRFARANRRWVFAGLGLTVIVFHLATLLRYPAPSCDESYYGRSALQYSQALIYGETWPPPGALFFVPHGRTYWLLIGGAFALLGQTLFAARLVSLLALMALVAATYVVGRLYVSHSVGLWAAGLVSFAWLSLLSGHLARPDMAAAAAGISVIGLLSLAITRRQWAWYFLLGLAIVWQMDLHLNLIHFALPLTIVAVLHIYRERSWTMLAAFGAGLFLASAVFALVHLGNVFDRFATGASADPAALLNSYTGFTNQNIFPATVASIAIFWWKYYVWYAPFLSLPQAAFFIIGLVYALASRQRNLLILAFIALSSTLTFGVVNQQYQLPGYALLWLPLYVVLGAAALDALARKYNRPWVSLPWNNVALAGLLALYIVGDLRLVRTPFGAEYQADAQALLSDIPTGARVLTKSFWWYAMRDSVHFIDDDTIVTFGRDIYDPTSAQGATDEILTAGRPLDEQLTELMLDYVITDQIIGCNAGRTPLSDQLGEYLGRSCNLQRTYGTRLYGTQFVYVCRP